MHRDGHGGQRTVDTTFWLTPAPPPGELVVVCACEALGIPETRTVVPTEALAGARERVEALWDVEPHAPVVPDAPRPDLPAGGWFERALGPAPG